MVEHGRRLKVCFLFSLYIFVFAEVFLVLFLLQTDLLLFCFFFQLDRTCSNKNCCSDKKSRSEIFLQGKIG